MHMRLTPWFARAGVGVALLVLLPAATPGVLAAPIDADCASYNSPQGIADLKSLLAQAKPLVDAKTAPGNIVQQYQWGLRCLASLQAPPAPSSPPPPSASPTRAVVPSSPPPSPS